MSIALNQHYLGELPEAYRQQRADADDLSDSGSDMDNSLKQNGAAALQATHTRRTEEYIYARPINAASWQIPRLQLKFLKVSVKWHRLQRWTSATKPQSHPGPAKVISLAQLPGPAAITEPYFVSYEQQAKKDRLEKLRSADLLAYLRLFFGCDDVFWRSEEQERVLRAVANNVQRIVQVASTNSGKSLVFMLPAFICPAGLTVVITPIITLQEDMLRRCKDAKIPAAAWHALYPPPFTISLLFVTPEGSSTEEFSTYLNRCQMASQLDRIVFDECHVVLDANSAYRKNMFAIRSTIGHYAVQEVYLTATLPPHDEAAAFERLGFSRTPSAGLKLIRSRTNRPNIRYTVLGPQPKGDLISPIRTCIEAARHKYGEGIRIIVYALSTSDVDMLAIKLGGLAFHSQIADGDRAGRVNVMQRWMSQGGLIIATSALGLGIDLPDVRLVIHYKAPRNLRDYAQESGRAGRDGSPAESVIVRPEPSDSFKDLKPQQIKDIGDIGLNELVYGNKCRRYLLNLYMDGYEKGNCILAEDLQQVLCDLCEHAALSAKETFSVPVPVENEVVPIIELPFTSIPERSAAQVRRSASTKRLRSESSVIPPRGK